MRYVMAVICVLACLLAGQAWGEETLALSKSIVAVKITNPEKQLTVFAPLLTMVDGLMPADTPGAPNARATMTNVTKILREMVESLKRLPGVNAQGDLWVAVMPPAKLDEIPPVVEEDGVMKPNPELAPPIYLVLPLTDAEAFRAYCEQDGNPPTNLRYTIAGKYAVGNVTKAPAFNTVALDLPLITKYDVVLSFQLANIDLTPFRDNLPPMLEPMVLPVLDVMGEQQANVQRVEVGLTMNDRDLSEEAYAVPVPGSPLAHSLETWKPDDIAFDYAGYLPKKLAYCGASGPSLPGAPGTAQLMMRMAFGILAGFLPDDRGEALTRGFTALMTQCSQGRALGITTPADPNAGATLVAVYRVTNDREARDAMRAFIKELALTRDSVMGGMLSNFLVFNLKPGAETIEGLPVDRINIKVVPPGAPVGENKPPLAFSLEGRVAYLGDKMLVTLGYANNGEMAALIKRVRQPGNGFTLSEGLKQAIGEKAGGFESFALRDLCLVTTSWLPPAQREGARKFLTLFPPQAQPITTSQDVRNGMLHGEIRVPAEQLNFLYALTKAVMTIRPATTPAPEGKGE